MKTNNYFIQVGTLIITVLIEGFLYTQSAQAASFINKPLSSQYGFIENKGQIIDQNNYPNPSVLYLYNGNGLRVQLRKEGFSYEVIKTVKTHKSIMDEKLQAKFASQVDSFDITCQTHRVDINFKDGNKNTLLKPYQPASDFINYYTTGSSEEGVINVHHFQKIVYENVYPNIDIEFVLNDAANCGKFKYNFIVKPNANLADIKLEFLGANRTSLNQEGNILIETAYGNIEENIPLSYVINHNNSHSTIKANFIALANNIFGIKSENYNHSQTLVIDPTNWATYFGGISTDYGMGIATDTFGNIMVTGYTYSTTAIATSGSHQTSISNSNFRAVFIAKFNANGTRFWATYYGGSSNESGNGITTDSGGNIIITGQTRSTNDIATTGSHQATYGGSDDAFIAKFNTNGVRQWATYFGDSGSDYGMGIDTDTFGNIMVTGYTNSSNAIATIGSHQATHGGSDDAFIAKFNTNGVRQWATYYGGSGTDIGDGITMDAIGNTIITGRTESTNAIANTGAHQITNGGSSDAFIAKFDTNGVRQWATYYGGSSFDYGNGITTDKNGNIMITGYTESTNAIATAGAHQITNGGSIDAFIAKFNTNGVRQWATYNGGSGTDIGNGIATDTFGNIMVTGYTHSTNAIITIGSHQATNGGNSDAFIAKFNTNGVRQWATYYGGSSFEYGNGITTDKNGNIMITGYTESTNAIATIGSHQASYGGVWDAFIAKFKPNGQLNEVKNIIKGNQNICENTIPIQILDSVSISNFSYTYSWISSTISPNTGFVNLNTTSANYIPQTLFYTTWYKRIITSLGINDTSNVIQVTVDNTKTWLGTTSNAWGVASNWSCNLIPVFSSNVIINSGAPNMPLISDGGRVANNITIANGAALTINNTNSNLTIYGTFINNGLFSNTNGRVNFAGANSQIIPKGSYARLGINNIAGVSTSGNINITDSLAFDNGCFSIGNNNLTLVGSNSKITGTASTRFVITNGTGLLKFQSVGATARTSTVLFPVGTSASSYTPLSFLNIGTADTISVRVVNGIYPVYSGTTTVGIPINSYAVNRTWFVNEGVTGGSNGTVTLQWNADEELPAMNNTSCYVSFHNGTNWIPTTAAAASGLNPYTKSRSGLSLFTNTALGIGSDGTLPIKLISFDVFREENNSVKCYWSTSSEINNNYFTVERSTDANNFESIGNVKGSGNSNINNNYSFTDANPIKGLSYYRLKQTDYDGNFTYSLIKAVELNNSLPASISLFYDNELPFVKIVNVSDNKAIFELCNLNGMIISSKEQVVNVGENIIPLNANSLPGLYLLKVQLLDNIEYFKVWFK